MGKETAWWRLPRPYKDLLQAKRLEGMFGGDEAVGAGRAPYFWGQEFGNPGALIKPQHFIGETLPSFVAYRFPQIMSEGFLR